MEKADEGLSEFKSGFQEKMREHQEAAKFVDNKIKKCIGLHCFLALFVL